ncbi:hypothetical protein BDV38DRAFT_278015 [Aspergillus pseudotamarii]|uniref:Uncharacterized protein n=1 Tax=Aspergillus pseudotamarii TaxID=132259 RepID=A0A5N6T899_ASPPS|nr:uncharacterized protein BDV38DRAFT_278015 [Aspergillus pseudotamarii]KAE8142487.1 hypothetical protein BDV38DRAFT_278015 [Aspergillus pseudotamarii]
MRALNFLRAWFAQNTLLKATIFGLLFQLCFAHSFSGGVPPDNLSPRAHFVNGPMKFDSSLGEEAAQHVIWSEHGNTQRATIQAYVSRGFLQAQNTMQNPTPEDVCYTLSNLKLIGDKFSTTRVDFARHSYTQVRVSIDLPTKRSDGEVQAAVIMKANSLLVDMQNQQTQWGQDSRRPKANFEKNGLYVQVIKHYGS